MADDDVNATTADDTYDLEVGLGAFVNDLSWTKTLIALVLLTLLLGSYTRELSMMEVSDATLGLKTNQPISKTHDTQSKEALALALGMFGWSAAIVYVNAYILDDLCPLPATITAVQQFACFIVAYICTHFLQMTRPLDISWRIYVKWIVPLAATFAVYLWAGNLSYVYLAPGYIQMLKPVAGPIIYGLSVVNDPSLLSKYKALNFLIVFGSVALTASTSDDDASTHALRGVFCILAASVANAVYAVGLQVIQARDFEEVRFNPLTTMLYVMPCSALFLFVIAAVTEWTPVDSLSGCVASLPWWLLLLDCACSVGFNLTMLRFIGTLSAVNYALYSLLKDIALLTIAFLFFSEELYASRIEGWAVTICGCMVWQHRKLRERRNLQ